MFSKIIAVCLVEMVFWGYFWNIYEAPIETAHKTLQWRICVSSSSARLTSWILVNMTYWPAVQSPKTHEVLKSWELQNKELCLHHTTGIKKWNFPEHSILFFFWCLTHLGPTWFECVCTLYITIICWMTQSSINNVYQGIMPILFGNTNLTNVCQWCGRLKQLTYFKKLQYAKGIWPYLLPHKRREK